MHETCSVMCWVWTWSYVCVRACWPQQNGLTERWGFVTSYVTTGGPSVRPSFVSSPSLPLWPYINPLKPSGHYMYHQFNSTQFCVLPTPCIYVFCVDLRTNSDYFTVHHWLVGFYNWDGVCLLRGTFYILRSAHTVYLCVLCGCENKQRLFHCTALTGWFL